MVYPIWVSIITENPMPNEMTIKTLTENIRGATVPRQYFAALLLIACTGNQVNGLERLPYNNPELVVDLGVGLWAWPLPMDWDTDGDLDLVVSCPDVPSRGIYLFENPGGSKMPVFKPAVRIGEGLHNIRVSYVHGVPRVLTPGIEWIHFLGDRFEQKYPIYDPAKKNALGKGRIRADQRHYVDYDGDGTQDLILGIGDWGDYGWDDAFDAEGRWTRGPLHGYVYLVRNQGTDEKADYEAPVLIPADGKPVDVYGMPSPNFADFDGDGDLDLVCGEFIDGFTYFQNVGTRTRPKYAAGRRLMNGDEPLRMDLCMIVPTAIDWDRDGDADLVVGQEDGRVALVEHLGTVSEQVPVFAKPKFFQQEADRVKFGALVTPIGFDWDGDGDQDIVAGNTAGYIGFIENLGRTPGNETPTWAAPVRLKAGGKTLRIMAGKNGSIQGPCEAKWGYSTISIADWDHDELPDLVVNSIWGKVVWYRNTGTRTDPQLAPEQPVTVDWQGEVPKPEWIWWRPEDDHLVTQWRTTPVVIDWNRDGLNDLVTLDHEGYLVLFRRSGHDGQLVLLPGERVFHGGEYDAKHGLESDRPGALQLNRGTAGASGRRKLCIVDWDADGQRDLLVNSQNVNLLRNISADRQPWSFEDVGPLSDRRLAGHTTSPTTVDWNKDGRPDLLVGAEDGFLYYLAQADTLVNSQAIPPLATPGRGAYLSGELIYSLDDKPTPECHASTIVETPSGLVAAWFGGTHEKHADVGIWVSRHDPAEWSPPVEVANGVQSPEKRYPCWNPVLFRSRNGPLMLFYKVGPSPREWWGMLMTSPDDGRTWSSPRRLGEDDAIGHLLGPVKNKPIQLSDGAILCPSSTEHQGWRVHFELTKDLGKTWQVIGPIHDGTQFSAIQPSILTYDDDRMQVLCRSKQGVITQSWSADGGHTWGKMTPTKLPNPNAGTDAVTLKDGRQLLVYNHTVRDGTFPSGRNMLNVALSLDGEHWKPVLTLERSEGEFSYPAVIQASDGKVHITYTFQRRSIKHVVLDPHKFVEVGITNNPLVVLSAYS